MLNDIIVQLVWEKGNTDPNYDSSIYRKDIYGSWMRRLDYGNRESDLGWEIDHKIPVSRGGSDKFSNLQPLNWKNNAEKQDNI